MQNITVTEYLKLMMAASLVYCKELAINLAKWKLPSMPMLMQLEETEVGSLLVKDLPPYLVSVFHAEQHCFQSLHDLSLRGCHVIHRLQSRLEQTNEERYCLSLQRLHPTSISTAAMMSWAPFPSVLRHRKGIWPVNNWVLVCWRWWLDWSFARLIAVVVTTVSFTLSYNKIQNGDILVPANPGPPGKRPLNRRERDAAFLFIQCFDTDGRATGRASDLKKVGCWFVGADDFTGALHDL